MSPRNAGSRGGRAADSLVVSLLDQTSPPQVSERGRGEGAREGGREGGREGMRGEGVRE